MKNKKRRVAILLAGVMTLALLGGGIVTIMSGDPPTSGTIFQSIQK